MPGHFPWLGRYEIQIDKPGSQTEVDNHGLAPLTELNSRNRKKEGKSEGGMKK